MFIFRAKIITLYAYLRSHFLKELEHVLLYYNITNSFRSFSEREWLVFEVDSYLGVTMIIMHQLCDIFVSKERHFFVQFCLLISFGWRPAVSKKLDRIEQILIEMFSCHASQMAFIARKHTKNVISYTISSNYNSLGCRFYLVRKLILWLPFYVTIHENKYALPGIILPLFIAVFTAHGRNFVSKYCTHE